MEKASIEQLIKDPKYNLDPMIQISASRDQWFAAIETQMLALTRQPNFQLTPAQTQLLPQILGSNLDAAAKQEAIKLLLTPM
jgi:hypothetical protein